VLQLDEAGFLLDNSHTAEGILDAYELNRWERNINYFGSYARCSRTSTNCRLASVIAGSR